MEGTKVATAFIPTVNTTFRTADAVCACLTERCHPVGTVYRGKGECLMQTVALALRRSASQTGLLSTVAAVTLVLTALVVGLIGYLDFSATVNTRNFIAAAGPTANSLRIETKLGDDPEAQSSAATSFFEQEFAGLPVNITRTLIDFPLPATQNAQQLTLADTSEARITAWSDAGLADHANLVAGAWPAASSGSSDPIPGALQADAAKTLGLSVGDVIAVGIGSDAKSIKIVATWLPKDATDQRWFSDPGVASGTAVPAGDSTPSFGPLVVDEAALATLGPVPSVHWVIAVDHHRLNPDRLDRLGTIATTLRQDVIDDAKVGKGDVLVEGTLAQSAATVQKNLASVRGVTPVGILLVALIGLIALVQLARLLSLARRPENALLRSRGASAQWLTVAGVIEAAVVSILGCGLGFASAAAALVGLYGADAGSFALWEFAVLVAVAVLVIFGVTAFLDSIRLAKRDAIDDSGRARTAATLGTTALALAAAGVAVWQSLLYGSPLITNASGGVSVNPLAVVAPTIALIAIALVLLVIFAPLATAWERVAARRATLQPSYSARQVARGLGSYAVAVLVVSLAVGGLVIASAYSGSWRALSENNADLVTGADARVTLTNSGLQFAGATPVTASEFLSVPGVTAATPVLSTPIAIGDNEDGQLTAIPHDAISSIVTDAGGALDPKALAHAVGTTRINGIQLPEATKSFSLTLTVKKGGPSDSWAQVTDSWVQASMWLRNSTGSAITAVFPRIDVAPLAEAGTITRQVHFELPAGDDVWSIVAIDYAVHAGTSYFTTSFSDLEATTSAGQQHVALDTRSWGMPLLDAFGSASETSADGLTVGLPASGAAISRLRYLEQDADPSSVAAPGYRGSIFYEADPPPLVVSKELAAHFDVGPGDPFQFRFAGSGLTINGKIAAVVPLLPGIQSPNAVLVDLNTLTGYLLQVSTAIPTPNQVWIATSEPAAIDSALPEGATLVTPDAAMDTKFAAPSELALWVAAIGCLLLAAISLGAVALTVARARRGEVAVLRAVGIAAHEQSRARLAELSSIILLSALFGVLGGFAVSAITVPNLAHSAVQDVPAGLPATLSFALVTGGIPLLGSLIVMLAIAGFSAARVRKQALDTSERIETR